MAYHNRILPKKYYSLIPSNKVHGKNYYLARTTKDKNIIDPITESIKINAVSEQRNHIIGYSTNLLGVFKSKDTKIEVKGSKKKLYHEEWNPGEGYLRPKKNEYEFDGDKGLIYLDFNKVHNFPSSIAHPTMQVSYSFCCKVEHKPTKCNFWHFEIHWIKSDGTKVTIDNKGKIRDVPKAIATGMRDLIKVIAIPNKPRKIKKLSVKVYASSRNR